MRVGDFVEKLSEGLGINKKHLASLLDVSNEALNRLEDKEFVPDASTKIMRRLDALTYAIYPLLQEPISPDVRLSVVKTLIQEDVFGNHDSVISSLKQDKYQKEFLQEIAQKAYKKIREKRNAEDKFLVEYDQNFLQQSAGTL